MKILKWFSCAIWIGFTPAVFALADAERGYDATGGEIFHPFLPLLLWLIAKSIKDDFIGCEEGNKVKK
jgi:hypothetical protein